MAVLKKATRKGVFAVLRSVSSPCEPIWGAGGHAEIVAAGASATPSVSGVAKGGASERRVG